ncbi:MAG: hypothetical protein E7191_02405 [Erysipelotrichaceae bacterium]|nr:hypothetical protein [Erysipelotrichaceae bacterium]
MKKLITLAISALMVLSLGTTVFATSTSITDSANFNSIDPIDVLVNVNVDVTETKYKIDVVWSNLVFTYTFDDYVWNPGNHTYSTDETGRWSHNEGTVTVTNHSNKTVTVDASCPDNIADGVDVTFNMTNGDEELETADANERLGDEEKADKVVYTVSVNGQPNSRTQQTLTVAEVTLSIQ